MHWSTRKRRKSTILVLFGVGALVAGSLLSLSLAVAAVRSLTDLSQNGSVASLKLDVLPEWMGIPEKQLQNCWKQVQSSWDPELWLEKPLKKTAQDLMDACYKG